MPKPSLAKLGKMLSADVARGEIGPSARRAIEELNAQPEVVLTIVDNLIAEDGRPAPDEDMIASHILLLGTMLEGLRYGVEAGHRDAIALAEKLRQHLITAASEGTLSPQMMHLILRQFASAKLNVGDELQAVMLAMIEDDAVETPAGALEEATAHLRELAQILGGDPFDIHEHFKELAAALPPAAQVKMALSLLPAEEDGLAHAALGFLLSPTSEVRREIGRGLAAMAGSATTKRASAPVMLRRLIALRNWLPALERPPVDAAIKGLRQKGVDCAPWAKTAKIEAYATGFDGGGMQSVFLIVKEGRKHAIVALIGRVGGGVRDAFVRHGASKREVDQMLRSGDMMGGLAPVPMTYVATVLNHYLAANAEAGHLPPFGLLSVAECAGLSELTPEPMATADLVARLIAQIEPDVLAPDVVDAVLAQSTNWPEHFQLLQSWFEDGDDVAALLKGKRLTKPKKIAAILAGPIEANRRRWADLAANMALFTEAISDVETPWREFAILARELLSSRPLAEIGLARRMAEMTLEAYEEGKHF